LFFANRQKYSDNPIYQEKINRVYLAFFATWRDVALKGLKTCSRKAAKKAKKVKISFKLKTLILKYDVSCMVLLCVLGDVQDAQMPQAHGCAGAAG